MAAKWLKMRPRTWITAVVVIVLVGGGGGAWWYFHKSSSTPTAAAATSTTRSVAASLSTIASTVSVSGTVTPAVQDDVSFGASGRVTSVKVTLGQTVKKGQVLATIDTVSLKAALASAKATLASAQAKVAAANASVTTDTNNIATATTAVTTAETAVTTAAGTTDTTDDTTAANQLAVAKAQLATDNANLVADKANVTATEGNVTTAETGVTTAQTALDSSTLVSPIAGLVATVNVAVGDSVTGTTTSSTSSSGSGSGSGSSSSTGSGSSGGTGASGNSGSSNSSSSSSSSSRAPFLIVSTTSWEANATVDDSSVDLIKKGIQAQLTIGTSTTPVFGTVTSVGLISTSTGSTASYPVVIAITGSPTGLHDGTTATVTLIYKQLTDVLTVPTAAIHTTDAGKVVYQTVNGKQVSTVVTTGAVGNGVTQILTGLSEGDEVLETVVTGTGRTGVGGIGTGRTGIGGFGGTGAGAGGFSGGGAAGVPGGGGVGGFTGGTNNRTGG